MKKIHISDIVFIYTVTSYMFWPIKRSSSGGLYKDKKLRDDKIIEMAEPIGDVK
jgi:hypothetical protein